MSETDGPRARIDALLKRFEALHPRVIDLSLGRILGLLEKLGRPQETVPPVVHVAGTNGKGSTLAFFKGMLEAGGKRVHLYTSPHLVRFNERIVLAGAAIGDEALVELLTEVDALNGGETITFFEITTAAAFLAFAREPADYLLLETGLGGRFDGTNVVDRPAATGITPISLDHQHYLGDTLGAIAGEKAGIIKPGVPVVVAPQPPEALAVIEAAAEKVGAPLHLGGRDWTVSEAGTYESAARTLELGRLPLPGPHQRLNAAMALALLERLDAGIDDATAKRGLAGAAWPGRLQELSAHPLARALPDGWELWLDGGHNPGAGEALAAWVAEDARPLHLIAGMLSTKDPAGFIRPLAKRAVSFTAVPVPSSAAGLAPADLAAIAKKEGVETRTAPDVSAALAGILARGGPPARVLICGSLYLAGTVLGMGETDRNPEAQAKAGGTR